MPEKSLKQLLDELDQAMTNVQGTRFFLLKRLFEAGVVAKEREIRNIILDHPYTSAAEIAKMKLTYATQYAMVVIIDWIEHNNSGFLTNFLTRLGSTALDYPMRQMARSMLKQYNEMRV